MFLVFLSIPLMILAVAVATVPLIIAMRREALEHRQAVPSAEVQQASFVDVPAAA